MAEAGLVLTVLVVAALVGWRIHDRHRASRLTRLRALADAFYPRAHAVLADPRLDAKTRDYVVVAAEAVAEPLQAWAWVLVMAKARWRRLGPGRKSPAPPSPDPDFERDCIGVMIDGLLLLAALKPIPGVVIRREILHLRRYLEDEPTEVPAAPRRWIEDEGRPLAA